MMTPILSFTAEEAWQVLSGSNERSVFEEIWHQIPAAELDPAVVKSWEDIRQFREIVTKGIEEKRVSKQIGSSLAAELDIQASGPTYDALVRLGDELRFVLIASRASVQKTEGAPNLVYVKPSAHAKCDRCWHYRADVNAAGLCGRCESNLNGPGERRTHA